MAGIEFANDCDKYSYNLVASRDFTSLFKINISVLLEIRKDVKQSLLPLYKDQMRIYQSFKEQYAKVEQIMKIEYKPKIVKLEKMNPRIQKEKDLEKEKRINEVIEGVKMLSKKPWRNTFNNMSCQLYKIDEEVAKILIKQNKEEAVRVKPRSKIGKLRC